MNRLLSVEAIYDGGKIKIPEVNIHRPCKVILTSLKESSQSEVEDVFEILLKSDPAFGFLKSEEEDIYTDEDLIERFE